MPVAATDSPRLFVKGMNVISFLHGLRSSIIVLSVHGFCLVMYLSLEAHSSNIFYRIDTKGLGCCH